MQSTFQEVIVEEFYRDTGVTARADGSNIRKDEATFEVLALEFQYAPELTREMQEGETKLKDQCGYPQQPASREPMAP
jgi:hypothetical protein